MKSTFFRFGIDKPNGYDLVYVFHVTNGETVVRKIGHSITHTGQVTFLLTLYAISAKNFANVIFFL